MAHLKGVAFFGDIQLFDRKKLENVEVEGGCNYLFVVGR